MLQIFLVAAFASGAVLDQSRAFDEAKMRISAQAAAVEDAQQAQQTAEIRDFADRFNRLIKAVHEFEGEFNKGGGNVWPRKKADAVNKAIRQLESNATWRQYSQSKSQRASAERKE